MKRTRFSETQIVAILKQADAGIKSKICVGTMASVMGPITIGKRSTGFITPELVSDTVEWNEVASAPDTSGVLPPPSVAQWF